MVPHGHQHHVGGEDVSLEMRQLDGAVICAAAVMSYSPPRRDFLFLRHSRVNSLSHTHSLTDQSNSRFKIRFQAFWRSHNRVSQACFHGVIVIKVLLLAHLA